MEKKSGCLFATDIASRGIDFPAVDWVIQMDCPEDTNGYVHRVGRTARYKSKGESFMMLLPQEKTFVQQLEQRGIGMKKLSANPQKQLTITITLSKLNAEQQEMRELAKKACRSYIKSVYLMKDKSIFDVKKIDFEKLAESYGLANAPQVSFTTEDKLKKNVNYDELKEVRELEEEEAE